MIAAQANSEGTVGIAPDVELLPVRIFGEGDSFNSAAAEVIAYAVNQGAMILSNSWTNGQSEQGIVTDAIEMVADNGGLFVAAAGNTAMNADAVGQYPAKTDSDWVISVGASDRYDQQIQFVGGPVWLVTFCH